jgi:hypothetical protein
VDEGGGNTTKARIGCAKGTRLAKVDSKLRRHNPWTERLVSLILKVEEFSSWCQKGH